MTLARLLVAAAGNALALLIVFFLLFPLVFPPLFAALKFVLETLNGLGNG